MIKPVTDSEAAQAPLAGPSDLGLYAEGRRHAAAGDPSRHAVAAPRRDPPAAGAAAALHRRALRSHRQVSPSHGEYPCNEGIATLCMS